MFLSYSYQSFITFLLLSGPPLLVYTMWDLKKTNSQKQNRKVFARSWWLVGGGNREWLVEGYKLTNF